MRLLTELLLREGRPMRPSEERREEAARLRAAKVVRAARELRAEGYLAKADTEMCQVVISEPLSLAVWHRLQDMHEVCIITNP